jgi:tripartite-type tricarboxylate transporter receptor subunit TctC
LGGTVDLFVTTPASVISQIKAGNLKAFAVTSDTRLTSLPDVPTATESGLKNYKLDSWFAVYACCSRTLPSFIGRLIIPLVLIFSACEKL